MSKSITSEKNLLKPSPTIDRTQWLFFGGFILTTIISILATFYTEMYLLAVIPVVILITGLTLINFRAVYLFLLFLLPMSVEIDLPGGFGSDIPTEPLMVGLMLVTLLYVLRKPKDLGWQFLKHPLTVLLIFHIFWIAITALNSVDTFVSLKFLLAKVWYVAVFYVLTAIFVKTEKDFKPIFWLIFIPLTFLIIISIARYAAYDFNFEFVNKPIAPYFRSKVTYATMITMFFPFLFVAAKWYEKGSWKRRIINISKVIFLAGVYFSYTRACILALIIVCVCYVAINYKLFKTGIVIALVAASGMVVYLVNGNKYLDFAPVYEQTVYHDDWDDHVMATFAGQDASSMERFYMWLGGAFMWQESKWMGHGPFTFYPRYKGYTVTSFETYLSENEAHLTIHNYYLLTLVEQGIIGFVLFLILSLAILIYGERIYHKATTPEMKRLVMAVILSQVVMFVSLLLSDLIEVDKTGTIFFINMAILVNMHIRIKKQNAIKETSIGSPSFSKTAEG